MSENETNENITEKGFFGKLSNGDFGLAKTYWLYNVLVGTVANILMRFIVSVELLPFMFAAMAAYSILALIGLWKSASKYKESKIWSVLAKIATVFGVILLIFNTLLIVALLRYS